jgi:hypothetical protein
VAPASRPRPGCVCLCWDALWPGAFQSRPVHSGRVRSWAGRALAPVEVESVGQPFLARGQKMAAEPSLARQHATVVEGRRARRPINPSWSAAVASHWAHRRSTQHAVWPLNVPLCHDPCAGHAWLCGACAKRVRVVRKAGRLQCKNTAAAPRVPLRPCVLPSPATQRAQSCPSSTRFPSHFLCRAM